MTNLRAILAVTGLATAGCVATPPPAAPAGGSTSAASAGEPAGAGGGGAATSPPAALPVFPEEPFRVEQPKVGPERPFKLPPVSRFTMGPAIEVYLIEDHDLPIVSLDFNLAGGSVNDPATKAGLATTCMGMLTEGTARLDRIAYGEALADLASNVSSYAGDDRQGVSMRTLKRNFAPTFALYAETLTTPGFRQVDFDRLIKRSLENVKQAKASPRSVAARLGGVVLYGGQHPLGRVITEASLGGLRLDDCKAFHARYVKPKAARLFVAGDITKAEIEQAFAPLFASWKGPAARSVSMPRPAAPAGRVFFVHIPGAAQSQISVVHLGPGRTSPSFFPNTMMAQILGGGFASRLNMNLREDKGYSYGARGGFTYNRAFGRFGASSGVRTDATAQSVIEILSELAALKDARRPPTDEELEREKNGAILGLPGSFATSSDVLDMYRGLVYFGLPLDYYDGYVDRVKHVTVKAASAAARRELKPATARILVVGDGDAPQVSHLANPAPGAAKDVPMLGKDGKPLTLRQALAALLADGTIGAGKLVELDADGRPVQ